MPQRDSIHDCADKLLFPTTTVTGVQTVSSADLGTTGFDAVGFALSFGGTLNTGLTYQVQEGPTSTGYTNAPASSVLDDAPALAINTTIRIGYVGMQPHCRLQVTTAGASILTISGMRSLAHGQPVANPSP